MKRCQSHSNHSPSAGPWTSLIGKFEIVQQSTTAHSLWVNARLVSIPKSAKDSSDSLSKEMTGLVSTLKWTSDSSSKLTPCRAKSRLDQQISKSPGMLAAYQLQSQQYAEFVGLNITRHTTNSQTVKPSVSLNLRLNEKAATHNLKGGPKCLLSMLKWLKWYQR